MRVPAHSTQGDISENMMTSMIDVVFLLLIFFVCAAAGNVYELLLPTELAASGSSGGGVATDTAAPDEVWIYLSVGEEQAADKRGLRNTRMQLNGTVYQSFAELQQVLRSLAEIAPESPVILDIAADVQAGEMVRVYDTCRGAGFTSINFNARSGAPSKGDKRTPSNGAGR
jgi:biopolymer transport protein ExbD